MELYQKNPEIRWADIDANMHLRHSVYYDWGAYARMCFLSDHGLTAAVFAKEQFGPVLFREECIFRREIQFGDSVSINVKLLKCRTDLSRWTICHEIKKNEDTVCAILTVEGAWIDIRTRKLTKPADNFAQKFLEMPRDESFEWVPL